MSSTPITRLLAIAACAASLASARTASAVPTTYTSSSAFAAALTGPATTVDFDGTSSGTVIPSGGTVDGISFTYDFGGVDLIVTDGTAAGGGGPFATTSPPNFLGTSDFDILLDGDDLTFGFSAANAIGLFIVTAEEPGVTLFDGDLGLTAAGATAFLDVSAVEQTLADGSLVYFLGVIDPAASFGTASLDGFGGGGAFAYNVDDVVTAVPEPGTAGLTGLGLLVLGARRRGKRRNTR